MKNINNSGGDATGQQITPAQNLLHKMIYAGAFFGSLGLLYSLLYWTTGKMLQTPEAFFWPVLVLNLANIVLSFCLVLGAWLFRTNNTRHLKKCYGLCLAALVLKFLVFMTTPNINFGWAFLLSVLFVSTLNALVNQQFAKGTRS